jgi:predicted nucleic acid-binding Zn ribbon protein
MERVSRILNRNQRLNQWTDHDSLVVAAWRAALGVRLAKRNFPVRVFGKKLVVEVEDGVWKNQLSTMQSMYLQRLNEAAGCEMITEIEFRVNRHPISRIAPQAAVGVGAASGKTASGEREMLPGLFGDESDAIGDPILRLNYHQDLRRKKRA